MKKSTYCLAVAVAFLFFIQAGCTSETEVSRETTVTPSGTTDFRDGQTATTEKDVSRETGREPTGTPRGTANGTPNETPNGTTGPGDGNAALTETNLTNDIGENDDASITARVEETLLDNPSTSIRRTTVETNDGVVTLSGQVNNSAEMEEAANIVRDVHGVMNVVNNMTIE